MKTAAIYCRVSTEDQEKEGTSLQTQLEACLSYCQDRGYDVRYRFCEAYSGLTLDRQRLNELRELVRSGDIQVLVVYCLDRLSRDPTHGVILTQELEKHHVTLEAVTEDVDNSELGKLISYIKGFAAKLEAEKIKERTVRGKRARLKEGKLPQGTGIGIYGYDWDSENKRRILVELEAKVVQQIFTLVAEGKSPFMVAKILNDHGIPTKAGKQWHPLTVKRIIRNSAYIGKTRFNGQVLPDVTPPIISEDLFEQANTELAKPKLRPGRAIQDYMLKGHAFCAKCGRPLIGAWLSKRYRYYQCSGARPTASRRPVCDAKYVRADWLEGTTWKEIKAVLQNPDLILEQVKREMQSCRNGGNIQNIDNEIAMLERRIRSYAGQKKRLLQAFKFGEFEKDDILDELVKVRRDREADERKLQELKRTRAALTALVQAEAKLNAFCQKAAHNLEHCTAEDKKLALDMLDIKAYATSNRLEIHGIIPMEFVTIEQTSA